MKIVPFLDLKSVNHPYSKEIEEAILKVKDSGWYIKGEEVDKFEKEFATFCGSKYCIGTGNGLDSLSLILETYKIMGIIKPNDEIIVPANTFIATILAIVKCRLTPVFVEPDNETFNIDPDKIEEKIGKKTGGIMVVHLYGRICPMDEIIQIGNKYNLPVIEDSAQAHGAIFKNKRSGNLGNCSGFSFYPGKNLGSLGDGGAITTNNDKIYEIAKSLGNYGSTIKYYSDYKGVNSRLDEIQAAILRIKLKYLDRDNRRRIEIAERYFKGIDNLNIKVPALSFDNSHVFHLFVIRTKKREELQNFLDNNGIKTLIHYPIPPHKQKAFSEYNHLNLPITENIHEEVLSLPISPVHSNEEIDKVIEIINQFKG